MKTKVLSFLLSGAAALLFASTALAGGHSGGHGGSGGGGHGSWGGGGHYGGSGGWGGGGHSSWGGGGHYGWNGGHYSYHGYGHGWGSGGWYWFGGYWGPVWGTDVVYVSPVYPRVVTRVVYADSPTRAEAPVSGAGDAISDAAERERLIALGLQTTDRDVAAAQEKARLAKEQLATAQKARNDAFAKGAALQKANEEAAAAEAELRALNP